MNALDLGLALPLWFPQDFRANFVTRGLYDPSEQWSVFVYERRANDLAP